jgi:DNA-binding CsgD family transcriptional regulator/PAS domain-containing protein
MSTTESDLLRIVATVHEAAAEPSQWVVFLSQYAQAVKGDVAVLQRHYFAEHRSELLATFGMTQRFTDSYNRHYSRMNLWREHGRHVYVSGRVFVDPETYPRPLLKRSEFFNDYLLPNHGTQCMSAVLERDHDGAITAAMLRDENRAPWQDEEQRVAEALLPHVAHAYALQERLRVAQSCTAALDALPFGVFLLRSNSQVLFANRSAETILRSHDGLNLTDGRLSASGAHTHAALQRMIDYAAHPGESLECPPVVTVPRPSQRRPFQVSATPYFRSEPSGLRRATVIVFIIDPEAAPIPPMEYLQSAYGLTTKEARLAGELASGRTVEDAAETLAITYETARTHLRRVFSKTQTSRQSELVALLVRLCIRPSRAK